MYAKLVSHQLEPAVSIFNLALEVVTAQVVVLTTKVCACGELP